MADDRDRQVVDWEAALDNCLGREDLLRQIVRMFGVEKARRLSDLEAALAAGDLRRTGHAAHEIKGMALVLAATGVGEAALALEEAASAGRIEALGALRDALIHEISLLEAETARRFGP